MRPHCTPFPGHEGLGEVDQLSATELADFEADELAIHHEWSNSIQAGVALADTTIADCSVTDTTVSGSTTKPAGTFSIRKCTP